MVRSDQSGDVTRLCGHITAPNGEATPLRRFTDWIVEGQTCYFSVITVTGDNCNFTTEYSITGGCNYITRWANMITCNNVLLFLTLSRAKPSNSRANYSGQSCICQQPATSCRHFLCVLTRGMWTLHDVCMKVHNYKAIESYCIHKEGVFQGTVFLGKCLGIYRCFGVFFGCSTYRQRDGFVYVYTSTNSLTWKHFITMKVSELTLGYNIFHLIAVYTTPYIINPPSHC